MIKIEINNDLYARIEQLAKSEAWEDDEEFNAYDWAGSNVDDAYDGGRRAGKILLAREIRNCKIIS